ncbi:MAG: hypothetical protein KC496_07180, partial [Anaerolineae bacterium]|nr:hypothetical protein [Anaerolineae bacterium]
GNEYAPLYQPRRVSQIVPAIALLTALGLVYLPKFSRWFLVLVLLVYGLSSVDYWRYKQPWREFVVETAPYLSPGTPLLLEVGGHDYAPRYHYEEALAHSHDLLLETDEATAQEVPILGLTTWRQLDPQGYSAGLPPFIQAQNHLWLFYWSSDTGALDWLDTFGLQRTATFSASFNPDVHLYRYDRLPDESPAQYQNGMILRDALLHDSTLVELLWQTETPLSAEYTTSVVLLDESGQVIAQQDSQPFLSQRPTSAWQPDEVIYDPKIVQPMPPAGEYRVGVVVYQQINGEVQRILTNNNTDLLFIGMIRLP